MQIHDTIEGLPIFQNAVITVGTFDGVHRGHQELIRKIKELAADINGESVLVTFHPHPRTVIYPEDSSIRILSTKHEKIELLKQFDVDHLVTVPFTKEFSLLSARNYIDQFLVEKFHPSVIVIGYNHQFGHHRDGNIELLRKLSGEYGFRVEEIPKQLVDDIEVSSTRIRIALTEGDVMTAFQLLGHYYSIEGTVVSGNKLGRRLGYPTANIVVDEDCKLIPADGIYAVKVRVLNEELKGVMSIGFRPTFNGSHRTVEVFIFDFNKEIYGENIKVEFIDWIREEKKFETIDLLVEEIEKDAEKAKELLG